MICKSIATGVRHLVRGRERVDSFFVIDGYCNEFYLQEALGECYVDVASMRNLDDWIRGHWQNCHVLVSLDYKYALVRPCSDEGEFFLRDGEQLVPMYEHETNGSIKDTLVKSVQREIAPFPEMCEKYGYKKPGVSIPTRVSRNFHRGNGSLTSLDSEIRAAFSEPGRVDADELILAFLCRENLWAEVSDVEHLGVESRIRTLLAEGELWSGGLLHLYDTEGLTLKELVARRKRAIKNCNAMWRLFPEERMIGGMPDDLESWLSQFDAEELVELAVVAWYRNPAPGSREKICVMAADRALFS